MMRITRYYPPTRGEEDNLLIFWVYFYAKNLVDFKYSSYTICFEENIKMVKGGGKFRNEVM
jgi:hypothetical protein